MNARLTIAALTASLIAAGGIAIAQDDDSDRGRKGRGSDFMLERVSRTLDLDESQQAAWVTFTESVRAQFPDRGERRSSASDEEREAAREARTAERESRQAALEAILISPEFDVEAFKALRDEGDAQREQMAAERQARMEEFRAGAEERSDAILLAYADFHRTLNDEQRQKLVWLAEQRGGGIGMLSGVGAGRGGYGGGPGRGDGRGRRGGFNR